MNYQLLTQKFEQKQNPVRARQMEKYLRNQFICYGIQSKERRTIYHQKILADKKKANIVVHGDYLPKQHLIVANQY